MIEDYNVYVYSKKERLKFFIQGAAIGASVGLLFYSNMIGAILLGSYGFIFARNKKKQKIKERKWLLNLQFKDGLSSVSAALNAGYSVENSFHQAVMDLQLMYPADAFILQEFEGMVRQMKMNMTVEEVLMDFSYRSGRFSGATRGPCVGHITPEAWDGGPLAAVEDGDIITIDLNNKVLKVALTDEEIKERLKKSVKPNHPAKGVLNAYRKSVAGAEEGAVWIYRD